MSSDMGGLDEDLSKEGNRVNGWSCPWHIFQVGGWLATVFFIIIYFGVLVPALPTNWQTAAYVINGLVSLAVIVTMAAATTINPADEAVLRKHSRNTKPLDRSQHSHAIENQHCYLCEVDVGPKSKHCRACNKCVSDFDHHCKWLNNCVGGRNYRWFIASLVSSGLGSILVVCVGLAEFICFFTDKDDRQILKPYIDLKEKNNENGTADFEILGQPVAEEGWVVLIGISTILSAITVVLLNHLLFFHIWLSCKHMSTYDYIVMIREKETDQSQEPQDQTSSASIPSVKDLKGKHGSKHANKVTPSASTSDCVDVPYSSTRSDKQFSKYRKTLEQVNQADEEETPPPLSLPLRTGNGDVGERTTVKKLKKKKKKQTVEKEKISTIGDSTLYSHPVGSGDGTVLELSEGNRKAKRKSSKKKQSQKAILLSDSEESLTKTEAQTTKPLVSADSAFNTKEKSSSLPTNLSKKGHTKHHHLLPTPTVDESTSYQNETNGSDSLDLNKTVILSLNSSATFLPDGSLDYSRPSSFKKLPLTPTSFRRRLDIPPLDLSALQSSNDSAISNSYQPFTGTVHSTDTYYTNDRSLVLLKSVPERAVDMTV